MILFKKEIIKKIILGISLSVLLIVSAIPVFAKTCVNEYDPVMAIGYGNINIVNGAPASSNPFTYSAYVLGTDPLVARGLAYYSVGEGASYNNVLSRTAMHRGSVVAGTTKSTKESRVTIMLYNNTSPKVSATDSI